MTARRPEAVLFDAGGVLLDVDFAVVRRLIQAHAADVDEAALARIEAEARFQGPAAGWREFFERVLGGAGVAPADQGPIVDMLWEVHQRAGLWTVPVAGGPRTVAALRAQGYRVAVVSNAEGQVARDLDTAGYRGLLETVVDSHLVGVRKPDPEIFRIALDRLRVAAERAVYVGDMPEIDVRGARAAGIRPILLDPNGFYPASDVPRIRTLGELLGSSLL